MNTECLSNPEVAGRFSNITSGSADWHVSCKCVLIKCKLIRLIDSDMCVLQSNSSNELFPLPQYNRDDLLTK